MTVSQVGHGTIEEWECRSLCIRIFLHRISAILTLLVVLCFVKQITPNAHFIKKLLLGVLFFEGFWFFKHLKINLETKYSNKRLRWSTLIPRFVDNHFELRYQGSNYPFFSLLIEAGVLTFLCVISGGMSSPFFSLFIFFCALALYILYNRQLNRLALLLTALFACFFLIYFFGDLKITLLGTDFVILAAYVLEINTAKSFIALSVFIYSIVMCGLVFLGVTATISEQDKERIGTPVAQTKNFLSAKHILFKPSGKDSPVFLIRNKNIFSPDKTLALVPYCSRGLLCPTRANNEANIQIDDGRCVHCNSHCAIGKLSRHPNIKEVKIIGSYHKVGDAIANFYSSYGLSHLIAVCCISNLANYLPEFIRNPKYKDVTVIYTPLLTGIDTCLSAIDPSHENKGASPLPITAFDVDSLIKCLDKISIVH